MNGWGAARPTTWALASAAAGAAAAPFPLATMAGAAAAAAGAAASALHSWIGFTGAGGPQGLEVSRNGYGFLLVAMVVDDELRDEINPLGCV